MEKLVIILVFIFSITTDSFSQNGARHEKVINARAEYVSKEMGLSSEEKENFIPLYKEYSRKKAQAKRAYRQNFKSNQKSIQARSADEILDSEQAIIDLERQYINEFESVAAESKVAKLFMAEKKFKKMLMKRIKERNK